MRMQKRIPGVVAACAMALWLAVPAGAGEAAPAPAAGAGGVRIAVVRIQDVFNQYKRTKLMRDEIEKTYKADRDQIENLEKSIEDLRQKLKSGAGGLEPGSFAWFEKAQEIKTKEYLLKIQEDRYRKDLNIAMVEFYKTIYKDFQESVREYAERAQIDIVIRAADMALSNDDAFGIQNEIGLKIIHYYRDALDVTTQVVAVMDRRFDAGVTSKP